MTLLQIFAQTNYQIAFVACLIVGFIVYRRLGRDSRQKTVNKPKPLYKDDESSLAHMVRRENESFGKQ